jgi:hypothetical protein
MGKRIERMPGRRPWKEQIPDGWQNKEQATTTATADPYGMTTKEQATATTTATAADPYGMTTKEQATTTADPPRG